ncbi:hypothetical protein I79_002176 [Cricetulus griseus]|uniref:Uncharacterized protein n=1 Tax=Cricetulus griseus TaxID=10029 RepID=G3GWP8_CRIGR|nr:hypothetical protein I79_002176 [Cricetulus griseus]
MDKRREKRGMRVSESRERDGGCDDSIPGLVGTIRTACLPCPDAWLSPCPG